MSNHIWYQDNGINNKSEQDYRVIIKDKARKQGKNLSSL